MDNEEKRGSTRKLSRSMVLFIVFDTVIVLTIAAVLAYWNLRKSHSDRNTPPNAGSKTASGTTPPTTGVNPSPPEENNFITVVVEPEQGDIDYPFEVVTGSIPKNFGAGKYVKIPENVNKLKTPPECMTSGGKKRIFPGKVSVPVTIPADGTYYLYARVNFPDNCSDTMLVRFGDAPAVYVVTGTPDKYRFKWRSVRRIDRGTGKALNMPIPLKKGVVVLNILNSDDAISIDQILITTNARMELPDDWIASKSQ